MSLLFSHITFSKRLSVCGCQIFNSINLHLSVLCPYQCVSTLIRRQLNSLEASFIAVGGCIRHLNTKEKNGLNTIRLTHMSLLVLDDESWWLTRSSKTSVWKATKPPKGSWCWDVWSVSIVCNTTIHRNEWPQTIVQKLVVALNIAIQNRHIRRFASCVRTWRSSWHYCTGNIKNATLLWAALKISTKTVMY